MKQFNWIWFVWLLLVILWNYIWVDVPPLADVLVAIFLSILAYQFNLKLKSEKNHISVVCYVLGYFSSSRKT